MKFIPIDEKATATPESDAGEAGREIADTADPARDIYAGEATEKNFGAEATLDAGATNGGPAEPAQADAANDPATLPTADNEAAREEPTVTSQSIQVNVELLENLMTMVSELVLTRNQCLQILRGQKENEFQAPVQRLNHVVSELQEAVMKTRMQPIGNAWAALPRTVRDLSHELGRKIDLRMTGEDTELDRQILELIKDPILQMVRNLAGHGLEDPEDRIAAGKAETGTVMLNAFHESGHIIIEIADDGRGMAVEGIKRRAIENGLNTESELNAMSDRQVMQLIFRAGFSTAEARTADPGLGAGMDEARINIEKIGGTVVMSSAEGRGTKLLINIPLSLAIVPALVVESCDRRFAIPQVAVVELVRASATSENKIEHINDIPVVRLRQRLVPLVDLSDLLDLGARHQNEAEPGMDPSIHGVIVIVRSGPQTFGIIVDRVFDTEEIVVKPLAPILRDSAMFSGNTILGDGSVVMILDPNGIAAANQGISISESDQNTVAEHESGSSEDKVAILLFRAAGKAVRAVPLSLVTRLEAIDLSLVERSNNRYVVQYRGQLMPLVLMVNGSELADTGRQDVLVFSDRGRSMGLVVENIEDIVEDHINVELNGEHPGYLGSAIIGGRATDVIDVGYYLTKAFQDWFGNDGRGAYEDESSCRVLLIDDSAFFRNLLTPLLTVAGYEVTAVESANQALELRETGQHYGVIISDIEMPDMNGFDFAEAVRNDPRWSGTPLVALSSYTSVQDLARGRSVGFDEYVAKSDRDGLLETLHNTLNKVRDAA